MFLKVLKQIMTKKKKKDENKNNSFHKHYPISQCGGWTGSMKDFFSFLFWSKICSSTLFCTWWYYLCIQRERCINKTGEKNISFLNVKVNEGKKVILFTIVAFFFAFDTISLPFINREYNYFFPSTWKFEVSDLKFQLVFFFQF